MPGVALRVKPVGERVAGGVPGVFDEPLLNDYLDFVAARSRPNSVLAVMYDLKVFFAVVGKPVAAVTARDVFAFVTAQRAGRPRIDASAPLAPAPVVDGAGVSLRTVQRRLSTIGGLYGFLAARGDVPVNPVPHGLPTRRERNRPRQGVPMVRSPRTLPTIMAPDQVDGLLGALRTHRDRAMVAAMLLGGLRRCEVLGLRLEDLRPGERRLFVVDGKGGHQRYVPITAAFFTHVGAYLNEERPPDADTDRVFVSLRRPHRGQPLTAYGLDDVLATACETGIGAVTCHQLRHTCLTRLRAAGMPIEAVQAQAGHASIESTRIYLHLGDDWLAAQCRKATEVIDAQVFAITPPPPLSGPPGPAVPVFTGTPAAERERFVPGFKRLR